MLWNLSKTSDYSFCVQLESLPHVVAGCKTYLNEGRFTWRHDSALNFLASSLQCLNNCTFYVDVPQYLSPSLTTGDDLRPDMLISTLNTLYFVELSVGFERNLNNSASIKFEKYHYLLKDLKSKYSLIKFVNLSISSLFTSVDSPAIRLLRCCTNLFSSTGHANYLMTKLTSIINRNTYYIFCMRNKPWTNPELLSH